MSLLHVSEYDYKVQLQRVTTLAKEQSESGSVNTYTDWCSFNISWVSNEDLSMLNVIKKQNTHRKMTVPSIVLKG